MQQKSTFAHSRFVVLAAAVIALLAINALGQCPKPGLLRPKLVVTGAAKYTLALVDINGDGKADRVNYEDPGKTKVALGMGNGDFATEASYTTGSGSPIFGDLNSDGKPDMLVSTGTNLDVWFNSGTGGFGFTNSTSISGYIAHVADFNSDGKGDLLLWAGGLAQDSGRFDVRFGNGAGVFTAPTSYYFPINFYYFEGAYVGDFNGDTKPDVVVNAVQRPGASVLVKAYVYLNDGSGAFTSSNTAVGSAELRAAVDLNGDGKADLVGIAPTGTTITALINNGSGSFTPHDYTVKQRPIAIGAVDFDGNGHTDLLVGYQEVGPAVGSTIMFGDGAGNLTRSDYPRKDLYGAPHADLNGDGRVDFVTDTRNPWTGDWVNATYISTCSGRGNPASIDFDGDGLSEHTVFRPSNGTWYRRANAGSTTVTSQFGANGDIPTPGDFDGDGVSDLAVFRPSLGTWYVVRSSDQSFYGLQFGANGDRPVQGDYDGDGATDIAVYRPSEGGWYYINSSDGSFHGALFGISTDTPVPADLDGDGRVDLTVYRASAGVWYTIGSATNTFSAQPWGSAGDKPVAADYDGDGKADVAVFRPSNGFWYVLRSLNGALLALQWGQSGDIPIVGYAGGTNVHQSPPFALPAVFRPSAGYFYQSYPSGQFVPLGAPGDLSATSVYTVE